MTSKLSLFTLPAAALLALTACVDSTGERTRTQSGATIGGLVGAVGGLAQADDGDELRDAVIGGAIGAGVGAGIGAILDRQAAELRREMDNDVGIINTGEELIVRMPQDILFEIDSANLRPDLRADLRAMAANLLRYPDSTISIVGHTDNTGAASYNQDLSERRANAVRRVLVNNGVPQGRIYSRGAGESEPLASNLTPEGRAQNRRVDITIRPN